MSYTATASYSAGVQVASPLEYIAHNAAALPQPSYHSRPVFVPQSRHIQVYESAEPENLYSRASTVLYEISQVSHQEYLFQPDHFLNPGIPQPFIDHAQDIQEFIEEAFQLTTGKPLQNTISIRVCDEQEFRALAPATSVIGFSINRTRLGLPSEIVVLNATLGRVMLTIGHEIGHVMTTTLNNQHNEEAKAFAFSFAWMKNIKQHNVANLEHAIVLENPANNGLHDKAHAFVRKAMRKGEEAIDIFKELVRGKIGVMG